MNAVMPTDAARLDLRLSAPDKERITRAAAVRGVPVAAFVREAVLQEAERVVASEVTVTLSAEESRRFLRTIDRPFAPNARMARALKRAEQGR